MARSDEISSNEAKDPDFVVEPMTTQNTSWSARSSTPPPPPSSSSTPERRPSTNSGSTTRATGASTASTPSSTPLRWDRQTIQFSVNAWVLVVAVLAMFPLLPKIALLPILCRTLEHSAKFVRRNFSQSSWYRKYLEELCVWVESNTTTLSILSSQAEIGIGFLLIVSLLSWRRNIIQTFMYWQLLKLMYHAPVTAGYHQNVWVKVGVTAMIIIANVGEAAADKNKDPCRISIIQFCKTLAVDL
ncbi:transmembrane protein 33 [Tanacetum coccineum]